MTKYTFALLFFLSLLTSNILSAQKVVETERLLQLLEKTKDSYSQQGGVSMAMHYYYANEKTPSRYIDSLSGSLIMSGNNYRVKMQGVETIVNAKYNITLFEEDHLMYLTRPLVTSSYNPVAMLDSLLKHTAGSQCSILRNGLETHASILFPEGNAYKRMLFVIDDATGHLIKTESVLKTVYLTQGGDEESLRKQGYDEYAIVEVRLSDYKQQQLSGDYFDEARFFYKKDKEFMVSDQYRDYKIFVATPNL